MFNKEFKKKIKIKLDNLRKDKTFNIWFKVFLSVFFLNIFYFILLLGRISPGVMVAGISLGGKTPEEAIELLSTTITSPEKISLTSNEQVFDIELEIIDFSYDFQKSAQAAYTLDKTGNFAYDIWQKLVLPFKTANLGLRLSLNEDQLFESLSIIAEQASVEPIYPSAKLVNNLVVVEKGVKGQAVDIESLRSEIGQTLAFSKTSPVPLPLVNVDPTLTDEEVEGFRARAENLINKSLYLTFEYQTYTYKNDDVFALLDPKGEYSEEEILSLVTDLASSINREPQNSTFVFDGGRVNEFSPAKDGVSLKIDSLVNMVTGNLRTLETTENKTVSFEIPYETTAPDVKTGDVNNLGIKELIGRGSSRYRGSISSRIHNLSLAASKFNGVLISPGETVSFNNTLGDVSLYTGYQQAYIIKDGKTVLGDGGGVCQVSTTFFRAILDAGLPVIERRAHAYRVGYYEQDSAVGFDATVYSPTTDLKFKNDTPGHLLIQTYTNTAAASLVFEIYGTSDGRVATTTKPITTDVTPPPEDLYTDDPTLPEGTIKQIDWKAWGAKSRFTYKVQRGGETIYEKTFYSNYRPWQAIFLRGTGPVI
ncbi:VanW family protein [Patescibacteria group bacterium]|nr:VanW family protein [Patescibacteria group bacterium]MBU0776720.1 VanW family protein [Patescibacteria group bacterium]MBU0846164.1 VanW family protein [Patescibacteria group bacterium]MBU0922747.1 VanW family protein [Patescibacteria group bacterium]MBU1066264.1 VanW family protein [Patescibacteria group bacterium]